MRMQTGATQIRFKETAKLFQTTRAAIPRQTFDLTRSSTTLSQDETCTQSLPINCAESHYTRVSTLCFFSDQLQLFLPSRQLCRALNYDDSLLLSFVQN